ncbi:hypothetical protein Nepgr_003130 [Nepenthes gracilis]|uniref:BHLH domain-containing protein n=1 Tax=Nepenthes gracilis TaxID=150966 RepID=A0AAD3XDE2_NEPGR|nr:hypothetical protein Nepgr_003130 [Nepenthes gracilis]
MKRERGGAAGSSSSAKLDRKTVERNRRLYMKGLCCKLTSLIPSHHFKPTKDMLSQLDQLDQATNYIVELRERVERLKTRKNEATLSIKDDKEGSVIAKDLTTSLRSPMMEFRDLGSCLELLLISGMQKKFTLSEIISLLHEEGAEVVSVNLSTHDNMIFHTLHAQAKSSRLGVETSRIWERLQELMLL